MYPGPVDSTDSLTGGQPDGPGANYRISGIYLHIPFCFHKCHYCDFYSIAHDVETEHEKQVKFVDRLIAEVRDFCEDRSGSTPVQPTTIFVGGGTPTLLSVDLWERLITEFQRLELLDSVREFTVEANPETVSPELMDVLVSGGVNRISVGAQSFDHQLLKTLERHHDPDNVERAIRFAHEAGIDNVNVDLIFAIPGQSMATLESDLESALKLAPDHISYYSLIYEPNTPLTQKKRTGAVVPLDEDIEAAMYERVIDRLGEAGLEQYEVSNWAKSGRRCLHNLMYWKNENWIAFGPFGSSHIDGHRWKNEAHLGHYVDSNETPTQDHERLDDQGRIGEQLMLGLRLLEGVSLDWVSETVTGTRLDRIEKLIELQLLERTQKHLRLTRKGLFVADSVIGELL